MNKRVPGYTCVSQQRLLMVMLALAGREVDGIGLTELAEAIRARTGNTAGSSGFTSTIYRDLHNLREAGLAEKLPDSERWRLAPRIVQIAQSYQRYMDRAAQRLEETRQRFDRDYT